MRKVAIEEVETRNSPLGVHSVRKPVSDALGTTDFAMNYFELDPGESFSGGVHTHHDQEEVFYVERGTATFEVGREREELAVGAGELVRFARGEFQAGWNRGEEPLVGWALGAPKASHDWSELESLVTCRDCGGERPHATTITDEGRFEFTCTECGTSFSP